MDNKSGFASPRSSKSWWHFSPSSRAMKASSESVYSTPSEFLLAGYSLSRLKTLVFVVGTQILARGDRLELTLSVTEEIAVEGGKLGSTVVLVGGE